MGSIELLLLLRHAAMLLLLALLLLLSANGAQSTRLPLEVYELTPTASDDSAAMAKHKSLEYTIYNAKDLTADTPATVAVAATPAATTINSSSSSSSEKLQLTVVSISAEQEQRQETAATSRRARQMLQQQQHQQQQHQHQQQQHRLSGSNRHAHGGAVKDLRILYQVGDSEQDLPICAPNAVCSKIDLYETPWIERQCRCPESNRLPNTVYVHHHNEQHATHAAAHSESNKYRNYYEKEKHKRLLLGEFPDKKFESLHLRKLMQKLGAVYEDELQLQAADYVERSPDYNEAVPPAPPPPQLVAYEEHHADNELPHKAAHMRHAGHRGYKDTAASYIGGCPSSLGMDDGHTIADKTRHYKLCQPVHKLPVCKHFRDYTWTLTTAAELNVTEQIVHCRCPKNSVTYLTKREPVSSDSNAYRYLFACSPLTRLRCQRKQPCKLFTVRKRQELLDEVNINALCQCPKAHHCPSHHTQAGVLAGESFLEDNIQTYSGYCMAND